MTFKHKINTAGLVAILFLLFLLLSFGSEYGNLVQLKENSEEQHLQQMQTLNRTVYGALVQKSDKKLARVTQEIRQDLLEAYDGNWEQFNYDYDNISEESELVQILNKHINSIENKYLRDVESDANDMFVLTETQIAADGSADCAAEEGEARIFENEIPKHFNPNLASQAFRQLLDKGDEIFWQFRNLANAEEPEIAIMKLDDVLDLPWDKLNDYEFLVAGYIDERADITGQNLVTGTGHRAETRRLIIVQGFNLYEQLQEHHRREINSITLSHHKSTVLIDQMQRGLVYRIGVVLLIAISNTVLIAFYSDGQKEGD